MSEWISVKDRLPPIFLSCNPLDAVPEPPTE